MTPDILDRLAAYAPTATSIADEWGPADRADTLAAVLDDHPATGPRLRFRPRVGALPARAVAPVAASVVVLALAGTVALVAGRDHGGDTAPAGPAPSAGPTTAPVFRATVATPRLRAHQWAYRALSSYDFSAASNSSVTGYAGWTARDGSGQRLNLRPLATCGRVGAVHRPGLDEPTQAFVDSLPAEAGRLKAYLMKHVQGSTSREEAIFSAVGDLLREGDLLASSAQRAAMVTVLAGLRRTSVHRDTDERGRLAVRVDFVDPNQRGDEIQSLYFDPRTFQLLEERTSEGASAAVPTDEPSAPYTSTPSAQATSDEQLPAKGSVTVMTAERIVATLPARCGQK